MKYIKEVKKEDFEKMVKMDYKEMEDFFIENYGTMAWVCGYGFYGMKLMNNENKFEVMYELGNTCD